jgi:hypothetical protein
VFLIPYLCCATALAEAVHYVSEGRPAAVAVEGEAWTEAEGYLEAAGESRFLYARDSLAAGDFTIAARLAIQPIEGTAASFVLGDNQFGFDGRDPGQFFIEGPDFGNTKPLPVRAGDYFDPGEPFEFQCIRKDGQLAFVINGAVVHMMPFHDNEVERFGLRPWRSTMRVYSLSAEGEVYQASTMPRGYTIPVADISGDAGRQVVVDREAGQYLGHPTTVLLEDGTTMLCVYPKGHGRGGIILKRSTDGGLTWSERLPVPENWETSKETPTIHRVEDAAGKKRLIVFSGLYPIRMAVSEDDGANWSPLEPIGDYGGIVAMSSVVHTGSGAYSAYFHDDGRFIADGGQAGAFTVYAVDSTDGGLTWGAPRVVAAHPHAHLCEPGIVRSPDGKQLAMLLRENSRRFNSFVTFSDDEGQTWSPPRELPASLTGDRHVGAYAPDGRLFITFRDTTRRSETRGDWVGWVGAYQDIVDGTEGQYRVRIMDNKKSSDCAYPGLELLPDGNFVTTTYGHWTEGEEPYVVSVRFTLDELDELLAGGPRREALWVSGEGGYHTYRIPSIIALPDNVVLAFCEARKSGLSDSGDIDLVMRRSTDGGATWSPQQIIWDDGPNTCGNPCPVFDRETGKVHLLLTHNPGDTSEARIIESRGEGTRTVWVKESADLGATWTDAKEITGQTKRRDWTWYATGPGVGIQLTQGERAGRLVIPCDHMTKGDNKGYYSHVIYSDDHGATWEIGGVTEDGANECQVVELNDGRLLLNMRRSAKSQATHRLTAYSADAGETWAALLADPALPEPVCQASLIRAAEPGTGDDALLFSNPASLDKRIRMTVRYSPDAGQTWPHEAVLHQGPAAYSCLAALSDGSYACLYEAGEESPYETITLARFPLSWLLGK